MREVSGTLAAWYAEGRQFAMASVVAISGSAPRELGAVLAVDAAGVAVGSVSGGCVEAAVYELCREVLETGEPVLHEYGFSDEDAFAVGLTCGGRISVYVQRISPALGQTLTAVARNEPVVLTRHLRTGTATVSASTASSRTGLVGEVFTEVYLAKPRLIIFGAIDFAAALCRIGRFMGYSVSVVDAREVFTTSARFPEADEVVVEWPHRYLARTRVDQQTAVCVLTHDLKFDVPLLTLALRLPVGYVGAMGSRRTHERRIRELRAAGLTDAELARLRSPIGLDLGGRAPEETALSIAAEISASRHGGTGRPLSTLDGPIHLMGVAADGLDVSQWRCDAGWPVAPLAA